MIGTVIITDSNQVFRNVATDRFLQITEFEKVNTISTKKTLALAQRQRNACGFYL